MNSNKRRQGSLAQIVAGVASPLPTVEIKNFALAGEGLARVTMEITHNAGSRADNSLAIRSLEQKLEGRMTAVAGSFAVIDKGNYADRVSGIVAVTRQSIPATDIVLKDFRATASNMFMDEEQDMWVLRKTEAGGLLVKTTGIDDDMTLVSLLESHSSAGFRNSHEWGSVTASASALARAVEGGAFVSYVTPDNLIAHGYVVASVADTTDIVVLPVGSDATETVSRVAVTEIHDQTDFPAIEATPEDQLAEVVASARGEIDLAFLTEYYKKVFQRSPKFYQMFMSRLNAHQFY